MRTLVDIIGIPAEKYIVSSIEIGINLQMACEPMRYIQMVHSYSGRPFIPMTPLLEQAIMRGQNALYPNIR